LSRKQWSQFATGFIIHAIFVNLADPARPLKIRGGEQRATGMKQRRAQTKAVLIGLTTVVCAGSVAAEPAVDAAWLDWRPRSLLTSEEQARIPIYCEGGYIQPSYGRDGQLPRRDLLEADAGALPIFAGASSASYST